MQGFTQQQQAYGGHQAGPAYGPQTTISAASLPPGPRPAPPPPARMSGAALAETGRRAASGQNGSRRISRAVDAGAFDDEFHRARVRAEWVHGGSASAYYQDDLYRRAPPPPPDTITFALGPGLARPSPAGVHVKSEPRDGRAAVAVPAPAAAAHDPYADLSPQIPHRHAHLHPQGPATSPLSAHPYARSVPNAQSFIPPPGPPDHNASEPPAHPDRSPSAVRLPTPSVEGLMAHFARTDELHRVRQRCAQVDEALARGVYPPEDSRAGRAYPVEEQLHLERQIQQCR